MRGKLLRGIVNNACAKDHPRGCGENIVYFPALANGAGSPPRMRGKLLVGAVQPHQPGITPADAGKTAKTPPEKLTKWDHPRGCGENFLLVPL